MLSPYSLVIRVCAVRLVLNGISRRAIDRLFNVSVSPAMPWFKRYQQQGSVAAPPMEGDRRSHLSKRPAGKILRWLKKKPDMTLDETCERLAKEMGSAYGSQRSMEPAFPQQLYVEKNNPTRQRAGSRRCEGNAFYAFAKENPVGNVHKCNIVICDNLTVHNVLSIREVLDSVGAELRFLPPYRPDLNAIEMAFSQIKSRPKKTAARTREDLEKQQHRKSISSRLKQHATNVFPAAIVMMPQR